MLDLWFGVVGSVFSGLRAGEVDLCLLTAVVGEVAVSQASDQNRKDAFLHVKYLGQKSPIICFLLMFLSSRRSDSRVGDIVFT
jgi:hypothetical protein